MNLKNSLPILVIIITASGIQSCSRNNHLNTPPLAMDKNVVTDIVYGSNTDWKGKTQSLDMDVYSPPKMEPGKKYPTVLFIHGGGFLGGDKKSSASKCSILVDSGFIAVSINYRLGWNKGSGQCNGDANDLINAGYRAIQDLNAALRFLVSEAGKYSIDTNWIFLSGSSAGGIAAICAAYFDDDNIKSFYPGSWKALGSLTKSGNTLTNKYTLKGLSCISCGLPDSNLITAKKAIPAILFHGTMDKTVPVDYGHFYSCENYPYISGTLSIYRTLARNNMPVVAHIIPDAGHGHDGENSEQSDDMKMRNTANFFNSLIKKREVQTGIFYEKPISDISIHKLFHKKPSST